MRNLNLDILKSISLLLLISAHTNLPNNSLFFQLRCFDVPLIVFVSGYLFSLYAQKNKRIIYLDYVKKRTIRLLVPTWTFLIIFFSISFVLCFLFKQNFPFSVEKILSSFLLLDSGIGYLWIIRIFLMLALISPFIYAINSIIQKFPLGFILSLVIHNFLVSQLAESFNKWLFNFGTIGLFVRVILREYLFYIIPYGAILLLGMIASYPNWKFFKIILVSSLFTLMVYLMQAFTSGNFLFISSSKFPPSGAYVFYGIVMSIILYLTLDKFTSDFNPQNLKISRNLSFFNFFGLGEIVYFISRFSIWIYFWHIFSFKEPVIGNILFFNTSPLIFFIITMLFACFFTWTQIILIEWVITKTNFGKKNSKILSIMFMT